MPGSWTCVSRSLCASPDVPNDRNLPGWHRREFGTFACLLLQLGLNVSGSAPISGCPSEKLEDMTVARPAHTSFVPFNLNSIAPPHCSRSCIRCLLPTPRARIWVPHSLSNGSGWDEQIHFRHFLGNFSEAVGVGKHYVRSDRSQVLDREQVLVTEVAGGKHGTLSIAQCFNGAPPVTTARMTQRDQ